MKSLSTQGMLVEVSSTSTLKKLWAKMVTRYLRRLWVVLRILPPFLKVTFSRQGLGCAEGRTQIRGKARRSFISLFPGWAVRLQKKHGIQGGCTSCGASCKLLFQCPHWDETSHLCSVYEDRPDVCRQFPVTPTDIRDRNLVRKDVPCGFTFRS